MNPIEALVLALQDLVAAVPPLVQPLIALLAGAIPFVEGEGGAIIGVVGGINPVVAALAAASGNFLSVLLVVLLSSRARTAVVHRHAARVAAAQGGGTATLTEAPPARPMSKGRARFQTFLVRFGVPGATILGPLAIPTQFIAGILVAGGTSRAWVLLWQAVAIAIWTTVGTVSIWVAIGLIAGF